MLSIDDIALANLVLDNVESKFEIMKYMIDKVCLEDLSLCMKFVNEITNLANLKLDSLNKENIKKYEALSAVSSTCFKKVSNLSKEKFITALYALEQLVPNIDDLVNVQNTYLDRLKNLVVESIKNHQHFDINDENDILWAKQFGHLDYIKSLIDKFINIKEEDTDE